MTLKSNDKLSGDEFIGGEGMYSKDTVVAFILKYELYRHKNLVDKLITKIRIDSCGEKLPQPERTISEVISVICKYRFKGEPCSISDIYLCSGLSKGTVITCIKHLVRTGVIQKSTTRSDRRRSNIQLSPAYSQIADEFAYECHKDMANLSL